MPRSKGGSNGTKTTSTRLSKQATAPKGSPYGTQKDVHDATAAVPLPDTQRQQHVDMAGVLAAAQQHAPPDLSLAAPTTNPAEPSTAGLPMGAGPGPSPDAQTGDPTLDLLQELYRHHPTPDLLRLIEVAQMENRTQLMTGGAIPSANTPTPSPAISPPAA